VEARREPEDLVAGVHGEGVVLVRVVLGKVQQIETSNAHDVEDDDVVGLRFSFLDASS